MECGSATAKTHNSTLTALGKERRLGGNEAARRNFYQGLILLKLPDFISFFLSYVIFLIPVELKAGLNLNLNEILRPLQKG